MELAGLAKSDTQPQAVATGRQLHVLGIVDLQRAWSHRVSFAEGAWLVEQYSWAAVEPLLGRREGFSSPEQCPGCRAEMMPGRHNPDGLGQAAKATFSCRFGPVNVQ